MIKAKDFIKRCNCRSVGECNHNLTAELKALDRMVDAFAKEMKKKLHKKVIEGYSGWDDVKYKNAIKASLRNHVDREEQEVDVANLAAMLWNMEN